jgi:hypothetical protein
MNKKHTILITFVWLLASSMINTHAANSQESWNDFAKRWSNKFDQRRAQNGIKSSFDEINSTHKKIEIKNTKTVVDNEEIFKAGFLNKVEKSMSGPINVFKQFGKTRDRLNGKRIKWLNPSLVKFNGFQRTIGNTFHYIKDLNGKKHLDFYYNYAEMKMKEPYEVMKLQTMDFGLGVHELLSKKWRMSLSGGIKRYVPNYFYRDFYTKKNETFESKSIPYLSVSVGYKLLNKILMINRPLVLNFGYTMAEDYKFPSADPFGFDDIGFKGFHIGLKLRFKI